MLHRTITDLAKIPYHDGHNLKVDTPSPWFVWFLLVRIFNCPFPNNLVYAVYPLFDRVNPSFVRKFVPMCIIDFICAFLVRAEFF